jgi:lysozyme family protein
LAFSIYLDKYVIQPGYDKVAVLSETLAEELVDSGVNFGQTVPIVWLQRWLSAYTTKASIITTFGPTVCSGRGR